MIRNEYQTKKIRLFNKIQLVNSLLENRPTTAERRRKEKLLNKFNNMQPINELAEFECELCEDTGYVLEGLYDDQLERPCPECQLDI